MRKLLFGTINILLFFPFVSNAQLVADTTSNAGGLAKALSYYIGAVGHSASIYTGSENANPRYPINDGSFFYGGDDPLISDVMYDGILYKGIPMWYDIVRNEVAVQHPTMHARIALNNKRISYFMLGTRPFVPANRDLQGSERMPDSFYSVLHDGKTTLLGRYTKKMFEVIQESQYVTNFTKQQSEYFLQKDGKYYSVKNLASLLNMLGEKKQELQQHLKEFDQYLRASNMRVKETPEQSMVRVLAHYDKISL